MAYEDLKRRVARIYPAKEGITALLPDWLADEDQAPLNEDVEIIRPSGYLALDENGNVYYES